MKKFLFLILFVSFFTETIAQPTLTGANINPVAGDIFIGYGCDTDNVSKGAAGAGITWNFSALNANSGADTLSFVSMATTPYSDSFPGSNLAAIEMGDYTYLTVDNNKFAINGSCSFGFPAQRYLKPMVIIGYPLTYNSRRIDTLSYINTGDGSISVEIDSSFADGYGTLILPSATHTNVLRIHKITHSIDSSSSGISDLRSEEYQWFKPGFHLMLLTLRYDTFNASGQWLNYVVYYKQIAADLNEVSNAHNQLLEVSPNPSVDIITINSPLLADENVTIKIMDISGKVVGTIPKIDISASGTKYSVKGLAAGLYFVRLEGTTQSIVQKIQVK